LGKALLFSVLVSAFLSSAQMLMMLMKSESRMAGIATANRGTAQQTIILLFAFSHRPACTQSEQPKRKQKERRRVKL